MLREPIKQNDNERAPRFFDCRTWKTTTNIARKPATTTGPRKTSACGRGRAGPQKLRRAPTRRKEGGTRRGRGQEALTRKRACLARAKACPNLGSSSKTDEAQSARQGGTEPGTTHFKDGRATTGPPAPRRGPGAPTVQPRPRGPGLESAQVLARGKICDFGPELGFEQRNRFRSLRDTCRTEKKVLRKPPAGGPVVGQTFKYIY